MRIYLAKSCDSSSDSTTLKTAVAGEQTAPVTLQLLSAWTTELLPQRSVVLYDRDGKGTEVLFQNSSWAWR